MFTAKNYFLPESIEEAWELNQNKNNKIIGGMLWLKLGRKNIGGLIDLTQLNLDGIEETPEEFRIGAMCSLRELEQHKGIETFFGGVIRKSLESIVGTQFRNLATVGGSIYSRFGFSDILTILMALDTYVELHKGGLVHISQYAEMAQDRDVLKSVVIQKNNTKNAYISVRNTTTDFPVLACGTSRTELGAWRIVYGARPSKAIMVKNTLSANPSESEIEQLISEIKNSNLFFGNMRASKEYRQELSGALLKKAIAEIIGKVEN